MEPISGKMLFDSADFTAGGYNASVLLHTITHEMAHVLGLGTVWEQDGSFGINCVPNTCTPLSNANVSYTCANAQREYNNVGCFGALPIETSMVAGSSCGHWREATLGRELMTPVISLVENVLSRITIGAMEDIYGAGSVDYNKASPFTCGGAMNALAQGMAEGIPAFTERLIRPVGFKPMQQPVSSSSLPAWPPPPPPPPQTPAAALVRQTITGAPIPPAAPAAAAADPGAPALGVDGPP